MVNGDVEDLISTGDGFVLQNKFSLAVKMYEIVLDLDPMNTKVPIRMYMAQKLVVGK